ncbi:peptidoglycan editing factor PgeF [Candidatus Symbiobacter mobilis]|uniref:Purine nucleoside phosphorylase n=1 Tax=Candidatus Symbiobacter mobilis CR TaxID=946483 RepID=U5NAP9_9BURK|nr:peptidoglycan editing factor PgeF [Candidatus Symbiobacter mobilis]AGX88646.1 hypothetical protein Cenrod_2595 [Candidatus Symbiobacter mobilis CR]
MAMISFPSDWIVPAWQAPAQVRAVCTTRAGGVSQAPFDTCNLADHVGDDHAAVMANRAALQGMIAAKPVYLSQVHGLEVLTLDAQTPDGCTADASWTALPGMACTVMVADCLPLLLADRQGRWVAAAHVGWRGFVGKDGVGMVDASLRAAMERGGCTAQDVVAWIGPCIGPEAFEVGKEVCDDVLAYHADAAAHMRQLSPETWQVDLPALVRQRLGALGVTRIDGNDSSKPWCTYANPARFYSYRRDAVCGRIAVAVWICDVGYAEAARSVRGGR